MWKKLYFWLKFDIFFEFTLKTWNTPHETEREFVQIGDMKLSKVKLFKDKAHYCFDADQKSYANNIAKLRSFNLQEYYSSYAFVSKKQLLLVLDEINKAIHKKQVTNEMIEDLKDLFE